LSATDTDSDRGLVYWNPQKKSITFIEQLLTVVNYYREHNYPAPTVRDVYYDMIGRYGYAKGKALNKKVYRLLRKMRRVNEGPGEKYNIPFSAITDDSNKSLVIATHKDPEGFWTSGRPRHAGITLPTLPRSCPCLGFGRGARSASRLACAARSVVRRGTEATTPQSLSLCPTLP